MDYRTSVFPVLHHLLESAQTYVYWVSDALLPPHPLSLLFLLPLVFPNIRVFFNELALPIKWPNYWSFSSSISTSIEYSWLVSFRTDWFDLIAVQGTLKYLLQHHSLKAFILWHSAFSMDQLSHPYMNTGKTIALTIETFSDKVISLLFNMLSRFVIAFLPRSKCHLKSWLQLPSTVKPKKIKSVAVPLFPHLFVTKWWDWVPWS